MGVEEMTEAVKRRVSEGIHYYEAAKVVLDFDCLYCFLNEEPNRPSCIKPTNNVQQNLVALKLIP